MGESFTTSSFNLSKGSKAAFFTSKSNLYSGSRRGLYSESKPNIHPNQILDESGNDVTPKSLMQTDQPTVRPLRLASLCMQTVQSDVSHAVFACSYFLGISDFTISDAFCFIGVTTMKHREWYDKFTITVKPV